MSHPPVNSNEPELEAQLILYPAYGRKYRTIAEIVTAWHAGRDFKVHGPGKAGLYASIKDCNAMRAQGVDAVVIFGSYREDAPRYRCSLHVLASKESKS